MKGKLYFWGFIVISNTRLTWCCHANILEVIMWHWVSPPYLSELSDHKEKIPVWKLPWQRWGYVRLLHYRILMCLYSKFMQIFEKQSYGGCCTHIYQWTQQFLKIILLQTKIFVPSSSGIAMCSIYRCLNTLFFTCCILYLSLIFSFSILWYWLPGAQLITVLHVLIDVTSALIYAMSPLIFIF